MTGKQMSEAPAPAPQSQNDAARAAELEGRLEANPNDVAALNELTEMAFVQKDLGRAMEVNRRALEVAPQDLNARTYQGVLRSSVGMTDGALEILAGVLAEDPDFKTALVYQGLIAMDAGKPALAVTSLERALKGSPPNAFLQSRLQQARALATPAEVVLSGTISLAEGTDPAAAGKIVYVSIRSPAGGPPLAAKQVPVGEFPLTFEITSRDAITMGGPPRPFPEEMLVKVKGDLDGNAMSTDAGAAIAAPATVAKGTTGLAVVLAVP